MTKNKKANKKEQSSRQVQRIVRQGNSEPVLFAEIKIGDYTLRAHSDQDCHLWMEKYNGEGMSFPLELLEKFWKENH